MVLLVRGRYNILLFMIVLLIVLLGFFVSGHLMFGDKIAVRSRPVSVARYVGSSPVH